ncbi:MAG TPA: class 1 fructose-bisphosphatase [Candidatus Aminicenantes bacterium]|nr:class 1 fructose-bisphosphatase [Candidatus Aminicenantes bacterium]HRY66103.1 class 1 fructose-bisphosphatase [Candidatus Aminicenantes bacterium]HRZ73017.1 class 1 fructose-bisphosphatase [Candidatus Aminicenantes bacterium]
MAGQADPSPIITIERHILDEQAFHPEATGVLTNILYDLALAGKVIASKTTRAGLAEILGRTEDVNVQGETVLKLDRFADLTVTRLTDHTGRLAGLASEENADFLPIPAPYPMGKYLLVFDPLDGSSNVDFNMPVGTIFGIYKRKREGGPVTEEEFFQPGRNLAAAGYIAYGTSTMFVYTAGHGVHGFTLDPSVGEFLLSHPNIAMPAAKYFSVNLGYQRFWSRGVQRFTEYLQGREGGVQGLSLRYIGTLVSDFHRNLLAGGVFYYPADTKDPRTARGKLRLLYEAAPLAFVAEQAGGYASDGRGPILDVTPSSLHQRTPLFIGNKDLILKVEEFIRGLDG